MLAALTDPDQVQLLAATGWLDIDLAYQVFTHDPVADDVRLHSAGRAVEPAAAHPPRVVPRRDELAPAPITADVVRPVMNADTAAVVVSAVDYTNGYRADLTALREVAGDALLVVDAIQGLRGLTRTGRRPTWSSPAGRSGYAAAGGAG